MYYLCQFGNNVFCFKSCGMNNSFLKYILLTFLFLFFPAATFAQVSKIEFVTDPQFIKSNVVSEKITIQAQDSSGSSFQTPETLYLELTSSSATGEFSSSETSWKNTDSVTMSKNSANRSFYYKDFTEGTYTITVSVTGKEWTAIQQITISSDASQNNDGEVLGVSSNTASSGGSSSGESSLTNVSSLSAQLEVQAGSDRTTSPGSPIWFQATIKKNTAKTNVDLSWSFGDGNVGVGSLVSHTYKYPGDYVVVLSAKAGDIFSVSRLKVKVGTPDILVSDGGEYLEIQNKSNTEINLFNWKLESSGKAFIFQPNTIILPKSSIKIDKSILSIKGYGISLGISLKNYLGEEIFASDQIKEVYLEEIPKSLGFIPEPSAQKANVFSAVSTIEKEEPDSDDLLQPATSTENIIYEVPKSESFVTKLTNFLKRVFSN